MKDSRGSINPHSDRSLTRLPEAARLAVVQLRARRRNDGWWQSDMVGGPIHAALSLLVNARFQVGGSENDRLLQALEEDLSKVRVDGVYRLAAACLAIIGGSESPDGRPAEPLTSGGRVYRRLARILRGAFGTGGPGFLGFPWVPSLADLAVHHWSFGLLRRWLASSVREQLPALGLLAEASARRTRLVRWWRSTLGRLGARRRRRRIDALLEELRGYQQPNGCWTWTVMATSLNLLALHSADIGNQDGQVESGLRYLRAQLRQEEGGDLYQAWAGSAIWDSAPAGEVLLLQGHLKASESLELARKLCEQQTGDGLFGFDRGIATGDHDSTAVALSFLAKAAGVNRKDPSPAWLVEAIEKGVSALMHGQLKEGGWGFAPGRPLFSFGAQAPGEDRAFWNYAASPDLSARAVLGLMAARQTGCLDGATLDRLDSAVERALRYFQASQASDGSWWARWAESEVVSTGLVMMAACAADVEPQAAWVTRARTWLTSSVGKLESSAQQAFCLSGLVTSSTRNRQQGDAAVPELIERLCEAQRKGRWPSQPDYPFSYRVDRFRTPLFDHISITWALLLAGRTLLKGRQQAKQEILWGRAPRVGDKPVSIDSVELTRIHQKLRSLGLRMAGAPDSIGQRIVVHYSVYRDALSNFTFPLLALHGAGWAAGYFGLLERLLPLYATIRFPLGWRRRELFQKKMKMAMNGFKLANQRVLADTYANYHFSKLHGTRPGAEKILGHPLLGILNWMHAATREGLPLTNRQKSRLYAESFKWEQSNSVWPMVEKAIRDINDPIVRAITFRPIVRFAFFPRWRFLFFCDFTKTEERIDEGWRAYRIAEQVGWPATERAIGKYDFLPLDVLEFYQRVYERLKEP